MVSVIAAAAAILVLGLYFGALARGWIISTGDRRRMEVLARQLQAEVTIDNLTRSAMQAMAEAVRNDRRWGHGA